MANASDLLTFLESTLANHFATVDSKDFRHSTSLLKSTLTRNSGGRSLTAVLLLGLSFLLVLSARGQQKAVASGDTPRIEVWESSEELHETLVQKPPLTFGTTRTPHLTITVNDSVQHQEMDGFGASLTDSSAWL